MGKSNSVIVGPGGSHTDLEAAIEDPNLFGEVRLAAGTYRLRQPITLQRPITLIGAGMDETQVICSEGSPLLRFTSDGILQVRDLTFIQESKAATAIVNVQSGQCDFRNCRFQGVWTDENERSTIGLNLLNVRGRVVACESNRHKFGILSSGESAVVLQGNRCFDNLMAGIASLGGEATLRRNVCYQNMLGICAGNPTSASLKAVIESNECRENEVGISLEENAHVTVRTNDCNRNRLFGIRALRNATPDLIENTCVENGMAGIAYGEQSGGTGQRNKCLQNDGAGIMVTGDACPKLEQNECAQNREDGIFYSDRAAGCAQGNLCRANQQSGIWLMDHSSPALLENVIEQHGQYGGIHYTGDAAGTARQNVCRGNNSGFALFGNAAPELTANHCTENVHGIYVGQQSKAKASRNECIANQGNGIRVNDSAMPTLEMNQCQKNSRGGIIFLEDAGGLAKGNHCEGSGEMGIRVEGRAAPAIEDNVCQSNQQHGISLVEKAQAAVRRNRCQVNQWSGIGVGGDANPTLESNDCQLNEQNGIILFGNTKPYLRDNLCLNNKGSGISVTDNAAPRLEANRCLSNEDEGIVFTDDSSGEASDNQCQSNRVNGIAVYGKARNVRLERNRCLQNACGINVSNDAAATINNNECESNDSGITFAGQSSGIAENNRCQRNASAGMRILDQARPQIQSNTCTFNGEEGIYVHPSAHPQLKKNVTTDNHRPDVRSQSQSSGEPTSETWTVGGSHQGNQATYKQFAAHIFVDVQPATVLERVARTLRPEWQVIPTLENDPQLPGGKRFAAQRAHQGSPPQGVISLEAVSYVEQQMCVLNLTFYDSTVPMWLAQAPERLVAYTLFKIAQNIRDWTGKDMPWGCTYGRWSQDMTLPTATGFICVTRY